MNKISQNYQNKINIQQFNNIGNIYKANDSVNEGINLSSLCSIVPSPSSQQPNSIRSHQNNQNQVAQLQIFMEENQNLTIQGDNMVQNDINPQKTRTNYSKRTQIDIKKKEKKNLFLNTLKIKQFVLKMIRQSSLYRYNHLTRNQFDIIHDKAAFYQRVPSLDNEETQNQNIKQVIKLSGQRFISPERVGIISSFLEKLKNILKINIPIQKIKQSFNNWQYSFADIIPKKSLFQMKQKYLKLQKIVNLVPVMSPSGSFKFVWDIVMMIVIIMYLFMIPIEITFNKPLGSLFSFNILHVCNSLLILDFLLVWNFGYFEKGLPYMQRAQITLRYLKSDFLIDVVASVFLISDYLQGSDNVNILHLLFFLKLKSAKILFKKIEERFNLNPLILQISSLIQLLLLIFIFSHMIGCIWISVSRYEVRLGNSSWISDKDIPDSDWLTLYIYAYYYSTVTMITVGYGDFRPVILIYFNQ